MTRSMPTIGYHIGFTGTQRGLTEPQTAMLAEVLSWQLGPVFHHGDCVGADDVAHRGATAMGFYVVVHPPTDQRRACGHQGDERREPRPFLARNDDIVAESHVLVACPGEMEERLRSGTWATVRQARRRGLVVAIVWPDGTSTVEGGRES